MPEVLDPAKLDALVTTLRNQEDDFSAKANQNDVAQAAAQASILAAVGTAQVKQAAHDELSNAIDALVTYVQSLR